MINYQILIDGVDYTSKVALPFKEQYVLDSALDNAVLTLPMIKRDTIFKPFTLVTIRKNDVSKDIYIASDKMTEIVGTGLYTHELVLIEETKLLEKKVVDTNTTTQPLLHDFVNEAGYVYVKRTIGSTIDYYYNSTLKNIGYPNQQFPSIQEFANVRQDALQYWGMVIVNDEDPNTPIAGTGGVTTPFIPTNNLTVGSYTISYYCFIPDISYTETQTCSFIVVDYHQGTKKSITDVVNRLLAITETLRTSETPALVFNQEQAEFYGQRDSNDEPLYPAPEFSMSKSTLRECLDQVGSYIHSIVRLVGNTIYFDKLGGTEETTLNNDYIGNYETLDSEQYASQLDSIVSNLTNIDDSATGTIYEPFFGGYKTVRAESGTIRIGDGQNDTSAIIMTDYPIEKVEKLICGWITVNDNNIFVGDITPYVYEKSEYDLLESYGGIFPNSKGYAITYTQGQNNITGLTYKLPNAVSSILSNQAILNIISQKIGQSVQGVFNVQDITELHFQLIYYPSTTARVKQSRTDLNNYSMELTSIYNQSANKVDSRAYGENLKGTIARLGNIEKFITFMRKKPVSSFNNYGLKNTTWLFNDGLLDISSFTQLTSFKINFKTYNGNTFDELNIMNAEYIGTPDSIGYSKGWSTTLVYTLNSDLNPNYQTNGWLNQNYRTITITGGEDVNNGELINWLKQNATLQETQDSIEVGDFINLNGEDYYISTLSVENQLDYNKYTLGLSKDFNALSKYIGIKNNIRLYEVSEKQSYERYIVYEDYCVIETGTPITSDNKDLLTHNAKGGIITEFNTIGITPSGSQLPYLANTVNVARVKGKDLNNNDLTTMDLSVISLALGNSIWLGFKYLDNYSAGKRSVNGATGDTSDSDKFYRLNQDVRYTDYFGELETLNVKMLSFLEQINNKTTAVNIGNALPVATANIDDSNIMINSNQDDIVIKKDNREQINFAYQLHFITNSNIIIGSALSQNYGLVTNIQHSAKLYVLPNRINKFSKKIDLTNAPQSIIDYYQDVYSMTYSESDNRVTFINQTANANGKSWVVVDEDNNLLFGKNMEIKQNDVIELPTMTFTHKLI